MLRSSSLPAGTKLSFYKRTLFFKSPTKQCLNSAPKSYLCYDSWLRICQLFTVLTGVIFQMSELPDPGMETISTRAQLKEHSILDNLAISDLQIITKSDLYQSWNLCYRFILLDENNSRIRKSPPNLNIAPWVLPLTLGCSSRTPRKLK